MLAPTPFFSAHVVYVVKEFISTLWVIVWIFQFLFDFFFTRLLLYGVVCRAHEFFRKATGGWLTTVHVFKSIGSSDCRARYTKTAVTHSYNSTIHLLYSVRRNFNFYFLSTFLLISCLKCYTACACLLQCK